MSATDELRRLLDERGVEWWPEKYYKDACTVWHANGMEWRASEQTDGKLLIGCTSLAHLTPAQAIAATLGPCSDSSNCSNSERTCGEWRNASSYYDPTGVDAELWCEHCDEPLEVDWGFCQYCGRRVAPDCGRRVVAE